VVPLIRCGPPEYARGKVQILLTPDVLVCADVVDGNIVFFLDGLAGLDVFVNVELAIPPQALAKDVPLTASREAILTFTTKERSGDLFRRCPSSLRCSDDWIWIVSLRIAGKSKGRGGEQVAFFQQSRLVA